MKISKVAIVILLIAFSVNTAFAGVHVSPKKDTNPKEKKVNQLRQEKKQVKINKVKPSKTKIKNDSTSVISLNNLQDDSDNSSVGLTTLSFHVEADSGVDLIIPVIINLNTTTSLDTVGVTTEDVTIPGPVNLDTSGLTIMTSPTTTDQNTDIDEGVITFSFSEDDIQIGN